MSKPEKRIKCGPICASIWSETKVVEDEMVRFHSINIDKVYKDGDEWKHTNLFAVEDLPKVALVAEEAYKYLRLKTDDPNEDSQ